MCVLWIEKYQWTRRRPQPGLHDYLVRCSTKWAIWHHRLSYLTPPIKPLHLPHLNLIHPWFVSMSEVNLSVLELVIVTNEMGWERWWWTWLGFKPGPPESLVRYFTNWAIWLRLSGLSNHHRCKVGDSRLIVVTCQLMLCPFTTHFICIVLVHPAAIRLQPEKLQKLMISTGLMAYDGLKRD